MNASSLTTPYIVLVDDNEGYLDALYERLRLEQALVRFTILKCLGAIEAVRMMHLLDGPAIFFIDYDMPDMDGLRVSKHVRDTFRFESFCFIASGHENQKLVRKLALESGFFFISKTPAQGETESLGESYESYIKYAMDQLHKVEVDPLTGLYSRGDFEKLWKRNFVHAVRYPAPISLILGDLNFLKVVNEIFGYAGGDKLLPPVGQVFKRDTRDNFDVAARYGGDEFTILLPETGFYHAFHKVAKRVEEDVNDIVLEVGKKSCHVSIAVGVATIKPEELGKDGDLAFQLLFSRAEASMKEKKKAMKSAAEERLAQELGISRELIQEIESRRGFKDTIREARQAQTSREALAM